MKPDARARARALCLRLSAVPILLAGDAHAAPLVWGSGKWGDTWQDVVAVPSLSPLALGLLAILLVASVTIARRRRPAPER